MSASAIAAEREGYPAWAGIDPERVAAVRVRHGLPRVGGDRPAALRLVKPLITVTPRGRG